MYILEKENPFLPLSSSDIHQAYTYTNAFTIYVFSPPSSLTVLPQICFLEFACSRGKTGILAPLCHLCNSPLSVWSPLLLSAMQWLSRQQGLRGASQMHINRLIWAPTLTHTHFGLQSRWSGRGSSARPIMNAY